VDSVVNEIPSGSCCKYRLDKSTGQLSLARALPRDLCYPANYGFIPHTRSKADDEELDILVLSAEPLLPLTLLRARVVGGYTETASDADGPEDRLLAVAIDDPNVAQIRSLIDVDTSTRETFETFVRTFKQNQDVQVSFDGWYDRDEALDRLGRGFKRAKRRPAK
jgi:inorganic pyrophosphatase